jgi:hypothetical protein
LRIKIQISEEDHYSELRGNRLELRNVHERQQNQDLIKSLKQKNKMLKQENQMLCDKKDFYKEKLKKAWKINKILQAKVKMESNRTIANSFNEEESSAFSNDHDDTARKAKMSARLDLSQWPCGVCHKVLTSKILFDEHVKNSHFKLPNIKKIKILNEEANLAESLSISSQQSIELITFEESSGGSINVAKKPLRFECDICLKKFQRKEKLSEHIKIHQDKEKRSGKFTLKHFYVDEIFDFPIFSYRRSDSCLR